MISKYAHSIKNKHIIHFVKRKRYLCNGACSTTPEKSTTSWYAVICKNCLRKAK